MSHSNNKTNTKKSNKKKTSGIYIGSGILVLVVAIYIVIKALTASGDNVGAEASQSGGDIVISKSQITEKAAFYQYKSGSTAMEIFAVKASDGTIRTALNTCQVCYDSGRGYYVQEGSEMVCQNCGNRFRISQIEKEKNGCNPVPILEDSKTDDGQTITISADFLNQNAVYFSDWKR